MTCTKLWFNDRQLTNPLRYFFFLSFLLVIFRLIILLLSVIHLEYDLSNKPIQLLFFYKIGYICIIVGKLSLSMLFFNGPSQFDEMNDICKQYRKNVSYIEYDTILIYDTRLAIFQSIFSLSIHVHFTVSMCIELGICIISMRGSILDTSPRVNIHYWLYSKLGKPGAFYFYLSWYKIKGEKKTDRKQWHTMPIERTIWNKNERF